MLALRIEDVGGTRIHPLTKNHEVIGRLPSCDLVIGDRSVSRRHAVLNFEHGRCSLQDTGSRFGTFVGTRRVLATDPPTPIAPGDVLRFGEVVIQVEQRVDERELLSEDHAMVESADAIIKPVERCPSCAPVKDGQLVRFIAEVGRTLVSSQSLNEILNKAVTMAFGAVPAERAFLMLRESEDAALEARMLLQRDGTVPVNASLSRSAVRKVMRERVAILAADAKFDPDLNATGSVARFNIRSFICAPLWSKDVVIGALYLDSPRRNQFTAEHLDAVTALANAVAVAIEQAKLAERLEEEQKRRERLQRYHSPGVVSRIIHNQADDVGAMAQERDVTVMFCDIVGFTAFCESRTPTETAARLNAFLTRMTDVVFEYDGTLDKYLGDALLAVFGAPLDQPDHPVKAVEAAIAMRRALADMNAGLPEPDRLQMRIGLNTGVALTGDIGSPSRREFTVLGDVVNVASRIEGEIAEPGDIVISQSTRERLGGQAFQIMPLASRRLRGRSGDSAFYAISDR